MFMEVSQTFHRNNFLYFFLLVCQRTQVPCEEGVQWVQSTIVHSTSSTILCIQFLIFLPVGISKATCRPLKGWTNFINKTVYWEHRGNVHQRKYKLYRVSLKKRGNKKKKDELNNIILASFSHSPFIQRHPVSVHSTLHYPVKHKKQILVWRSVWMQDIYYDGGVAHVRPPYQLNLSIKLIKM